MKRDYLFPPVPDVRGMVKLTEDTDLDASMLGAVIDLDGHDLNLVGIEGHGVFHLVGPGSYSGALEGELIEEEAQVITVIEDSFRAAAVTRGEFLSHGHNVATTSAPGFMSAGDRQMLNGLVYGSDGLTYSFGVWDQANGDPGITINDGVLAFPFLTEVDLTPGGRAAWQSALQWSLKANLSSPAFTDVPTAPTAAPGTNTGQIATTAFVIAMRDALVNGAPGLLDTLNEFAAALGNDPNFAATVTGNIASKLPLAGGSMSGMIILMPSTGPIANEASNPGLRVFSSGGNAAYIEFHRQGSFASLLGVDTDNKLKWGGYSMGAVAHEIIHTGNHTVIPLASDTVAGLLSASNKKKLDGVHRWEPSFQAPFVTVSGFHPAGDQESQPAISVTKEGGVYSVTFADPPTGTYSVSATAAWFQTFAGLAGLYWDAASEKGWAHGLWDSANGERGLTVNDGEFFLKDNGGGKSVVLEGGWLVAWQAGLGLVKKDGDTMTGKLTGKACVTTMILSTGGESFEVINSGGGTEAFMTFHRSGVYATNFGLDANNEFAFGGWSEGAIKHRFWTGKNTVHAHPTNKCYYFATWGGAGSEGDPLRPYNGWVYPNGNVQNIRAQALDRASCYISLDNVTAGAIDIFVSGPGYFYISTYLRNKVIRVWGDGQAIVQIQVAQDWYSELSTGNLLVTNCRLSGIGCGLRTKLVNCTAVNSWVQLEIRHISGYDGDPYNPYGSGGSYSFLSYDLDLIGCTLESGFTIYCDDFKAFTSTFLGSYGYSWTSSNLYNCHPASI